MLSLETVDSLERKRLLLQDKLDAKKSPLQRNMLGQFATPTGLARDMLKYAVAKLPPDEPVRFFDPAFGTGSFYSAFLHEFRGSVEWAAGYENDELIANETKRLWAETKLGLTIQDFTVSQPGKNDKANLVICNPPYVRHHHLSQEYKKQLGLRVEELDGIRLSGLSGYYCYYMLLMHQWMSDGGIAGWLIPSEFMDVNYGAGVKKYLTELVSLLGIHRFDPREIQFSDADVSSVVVFFKKELPNDGAKVEITFGGSLLNPNVAKSLSISDLRGIPKWTSAFEKGRALKAGDFTLGDFFTVKRGLATGDNGFFIVDEERAKRNSIPPRFLKPILPMPRDLKQDEVKAESSGNPAVKPKLFLIACNLPEADVKAQFPALWDYFQGGERTGVSEAYLCRHRKPWYSQEERAPAPFLCSYMGRTSSHRKTPFRFILNRSNATASNSYILLYPKSDIAAYLAADGSRYQKLWIELRSITSETMISGGRVYGGGLHKLEPRELANLPIPDLTDILSNRAATVP